MDRTLDNQEKEKVRTARSKFFQLLKPKDSTHSNPYLNHPYLNTFTYSDAQPDFSFSERRFKASNMPFSRSSSSGSKIPLIIRFYDPDTPPQLAKDVHDRTLEEILSWEDVQLERSHNYIQMLFPLPEGSMFNWEAPIITREIMEAFHSRIALRNRLRMSFERMLDFYGFAVSIKPEEDMEEEEHESETGDHAEPATHPLTSQETGTDQSTDSTRLTTEDGTQGPLSNPVPSDTEIPASNMDVESPVPVATQQTDIPKDNSQPSTAEATAETPSESNAVTQPEPFGYHVVRGPHWRIAFRNWAIRFDHNHLRITRILRCLRVLGLRTECNAFYTALQRVFDDPGIRINQRSMIYWHRAATRRLYVAPDDDKCAWLRNWEEERGVFVDE